MRNRKPCRLLALLNFFFTISPIHISTKAATENKTLTIGVVLPSGVQAIDYPPRRELGKRVEAVTRVNDVPLI